MPPKYTRTGEKSWPKRLSMSRLSGGSKGRPAPANVRSTPARAEFVCWIDSSENRRIDSGTPPTTADGVARIGDPIRFSFQGIVTRAHETFSLEALLFGALLAKPVTAGAGRAFPLHGVPCKSGRENRSTCGIRHAHNSLRNSIGFLLEAVVRRANPKFRLHDRVRERRRADGTWLCRLFPRKCGPAAFRLLKRGQFHVIFEPDR